MSNFQSTHRREARFYWVVLGIRIPPPLRHFNGENDRRNICSGGRFFCYKSVKFSVRDGALYFLGELTVMATLERVHVLLTPNREGVPIARNRICLRHLKDPKSFSGFKFKNGCELFPNANDQSKGLLIHVGRDIILLDRFACDNPAEVFRQMLRYGLRYFHAHKDNRFRLLWHHLIGKPFFSPAAINCAWLVQSLNISSSISQASCTSFAQTFTCRP